MVADDDKPNFLVLTEDGGPNGKNAFETVRRLTAKLFTYIDSSLNTNEIDFEPATEEARKVLVSNQWVAPDHPQRYRLHQFLAAQLRLDNGFVVHHFDGDSRWGDRNHDEPLEAKPVQAELLNHVRVILEGKEKNLERVDRMMLRYLRLVPYREIEAWLYQNTEKVRAFTCGRPACGCLRQLDEWREDRGLLDESDDPAKALPCVGKSHNKELVRGFPTHEVYEVEKSLAASINKMLDCQDLLGALKSTYARPLPEEPQA